MDGTYFYSDEEIQKQTVIYVSKLPVKPILAADKKAKCEPKKAEPPKKDELSAVHIPEISRTVTDAAASSKPFSAMEKFDVFVPALSGKQLGITPARE